MKGNIWLYTVCWNEIDILPFVVDYWKRFAQKVIVYDNGSTDGTLEFLKKFDWIEVRSFETDGFNDIVHMRIKNEVWKEARGKADFVVVCDMDECLYSPVLEEEMEYMLENGFTICGPEQYALVGDNYPEYKDNMLLHEIITRVRLQKSNHTPHLITTGKLMLFNPNAIKEINYSAGCHTANPIGNVKLYDRKQIFCIHINRGFGVDYNIRRVREYEKRLSNTNKKYKLGIHYTFSDEEIIRNYQNGIKNSLNIMDVLAKFSANNKHGK